MKKVSVNRVLELANELLANSEDGSKELCTLVETILHETRNYRGYNNIYWLQSGYERWVEDGRPDDKTPYYGPKYQRRYY